MYDPDLMMYLILSHHGCLRGPRSVCLPEHGTAPRYQDPYGSPWARAMSRFRCLNDHYGPHTLALVEAILRLTDWDILQELE